jgi:membrane AbrB-like protein
MMVMAGAFGSDARLVAFMQYLRVVMVAGVASLVARLWVGASGAPPARAQWFPAMELGDFAITMLIAATGGVIGIVLRIPGGALLAPMVIGATLEALGLVRIVLPQWLLAISYAGLGWSIGLGFTRDILLHVRRALPQVLLANIVLIGASAALALVVVEVAGVDLLTAYLATSPGGMDSVAIIGASSNVDLSFVMGLQIVRLIIVLMAGPPLARFVARRVD